MIIYYVSGIADRLLHMLTEERDEKVLNAVTNSLLTLSKTHSKQIVQNMIHYKLQNSVNIIFVQIYLMHMHLLLMFLFNLVLNYICFLILLFLNFITCIL